jgi:hypothetical protein
MRTHNRRPLKNGRRRVEGRDPGVDFAAILNTADNLAFRNAFNKPAGDGYQAFLDFNGDGVINSGDNLQFRTRFNKSLTWRV